jgi:DNA polymerase-3 subunit epsilon
MILAMDLETTGLVLWKTPSDDPGQPHIVQFAAKLVDPNTRQAIAAWDLVVRPDGWIIPPAAIAIHGITQEEAVRLGVKESIVTRTYMDAWARASVILGYVPLFDQRIMRIALLRDGASRRQIEALERKPIVDVMQAATPRCKLPPSSAMMAAGNNTFKSPTLTQAVRTLLGERVTDAHNATTDLEMTLRLHWHIQDLTKGHTPNERPTANRTEPGGIQDPEGLPQPG